MFSKKYNALGKLNRRKAWGISDCVSSSLQALQGDTSAGEPGLGWLQFEMFPRLVGRFCSYLLPKQAGGNSPNQSQPNPGLPADVSPCMIVNFRNLHTFQPLLVRLRPRKGPRGTWSCRRAWNNLFIENIYILGVKSDISCLNDCRNSDHRIIA